MIAQSRIYSIGELLSHSVRTQPRSEHSRRFLEKRCALPKNRIICIMVSRLGLTKWKAQLCGVFFLASAVPLIAQLKWDSLEQTFKPAQLDKAVVAKYRFMNTGTTAVTINEVRTSCGCTMVALEKKEYGPGESGEIEAKFQFAGHIGHQEKWIFVTTNLAPSEPTLLRLVVDIPIAVTIQPEFVMWRVGEAVEPKTVRVTVADEFPAKIVSVEADNQKMKLEMREIRSGKEVEVKVTPFSTDTPQSTTLSIRTDYPPENPETHYAYARVK
jgi:Protein of unknown function (DUF1573)